jgi:hypothetical protein
MVCSYLLLGKYYKISKDRINHKINMCTCILQFEVNESFFFWQKSKWGYKVYTGVLLQSLSLKTTN